MTLAVNGKPAAKGKAGGLIDRQPVEDFCVGHDNRVPLDVYDGKARVCRLDRTTQGGMQDEVIAVGEIQIKAGKPAA